jgi:hypothetical protein
LKELKPLFRKPDLLKDRRHVLVVGAQRSGTTLLATMISLHPEAGMLNEDITGVGIRKLLGRRVTGTKLLVPNQIQLNRRSVFRLRFFKKIGLITESPRSRFSIEEYLMLPNLCVVAIIREGNDTVSSMMRRGGVKFDKAARRWGQAIDTIYEVKRRYAEKTLVVSFEQLVAKPEATMRAVCRFLDLSFHPQMLEGPKYNPTYPQDQFAVQKVHRSENEGTDYLSVRMPATYRRYRELMSSVALFLWVWFVPSAVSYDKFPAISEVSCITGQDGVQTTL